MILLVGYVSFLGGIDPPFFFKFPGIRWWTPGAHGLLVSKDLRFLSIGSMYGIPSLKLTASLHLKIDGWKIVPFLFGTPYFQVLSLFQGSKYLHLVDLSGKCMVNVWYTYPTWILWAIGWTYTKQHPDKQSLVLFIVKFESWSTDNVCVEVIKMISKGSTWMTMCWQYIPFNDQLFSPRNLQSWQIQEPFFGSWKLPTMFSQPSSFPENLQNPWNSQAPQTQ